MEAQRANWPAAARSKSRSATTPARATFPQGAVKLDAAGKISISSLGPPGSGGLLVALHLWRRLLVDGPEKFGDVYYYGTAPYAAIEGQAEVSAWPRATWPRCI